MPDYICQDRYNPIWTRFLLMNKDKKHLEKFISEVWERK